MRRASGGNILTVPARIGLCFQALIAAAILTLPAWPQTNEKPWSGVLRNDAGAVIAGATVRLSAGDKQASAATDREGRFSFPAVAPGDYAIAVESQGKTATHSGRIQLPDERTAVLVLGFDGVLSLGQGEQREGTGGERLSDKEVSGLPLNKRDFRSEEHTSELQSLR